MVVNIIISIIIAVGLLAWVAYVIVRCVGLGDRSSEDGLDIGEHK